MDTSNSRAYQVQSEIAANSSNIIAQRSSCVSAAISECKVKNIEAANGYDSCLTKIPYQREQIVQVVQQEQPQNQQPEQHAEQKPVQHSQQSHEKPVQHSESEQKPVQQLENQLLAQPEKQPEQQAINYN